MSGCSNSKMSAFVGMRGFGDEEGIRGVCHEGSRPGGGCAECAGEAAEPGRGGGTAGPWGPAGGEAINAVPGAWCHGAGIRSPRRAAEQRHRGGGSGRDHGAGAEALRGLRPDAGVREARRGPWTAAVGGDASAMDDRRGPVEGQGPARGAHSPGPPAAPAARGAGADRRLAARLVRGPGAAVHAGRVRRRRHEPPAGAAVRAGGDHRPRTCA